MLKKATLEHVISHDLSDLWSVLTRDEKRLVTDSFVIHNFKKNQIIYAEKEEPEFLWCLLKGKVKMYKNGIGDRVQILRLRCSISATVHILPTSCMCPALPLLSRR